MAMRDRVDNRRCCGRRMDQGGIGEDDVLNGRRMVYPQEALRVAQEMRCDRYCECSAVTGDVGISPDLSKFRFAFRKFEYVLTWSKLCREVFEDIATTAAMTTHTYPVFALVAYETS